MEPLDGTLPQKIGVIGDVHAEAETLHAALNYLKGLGLTTFLCTGDIVDGPGDVNRCVALLEQFGVVTIMGNHDRWFLEGTKREEPDATKPEEVSEHTREYIEGLPVTREFETALGPLLFCHGIGRNDTARLMPGDGDYKIEQNAELQALVHMRRYRLVLGGHTHHRMVREFGGLTFLNAGTLKQDNEPCFLTVDFGEGVAQFYSMDKAMQIKQADRESITK